MKNGSFWRDPTLKVCTSTCGAGQDSVPPNFTKTKTEFLTAYSGSHLGPTRQLRIKLERRTVPPSKAKLARANEKTDPGKPSGAGQLAER
jgi:hypothetical protein